MFQDSSELFSPSVKRRALRSRLSGYRIEKDRKACLGKLFLIRFTDLCVLGANILEVCSKFRYLNMTRDTSQRFTLTQSSEPRWGSIRHRQTSSIQTGPGPATAARSTSFQLFSSRPRWSSAKCRVVYPGASSQGVPKTAPRAGAGLSSCEGHGQATSTVFFSPPERCCSSLCASRSPHCTPFLAT